LKKLDYLSRSQLQRLHNLSGDRNARRVMDNMSEYVSSFRSESGEKVYHLNKAGRERIASDVVRNKTSQVGHYLMRNDYYIYRRPYDWRNEIKISVDKTVSVIPDAYFKYDKTLHFLEVDHLQRMFKNREKIARYKKLKETEVFQQKYKHFPHLIWITLTENRKRQILEWCKDFDVTVHVWHEIK
jgi:hypothetical protein